MEKIKKIIRKYYDDLTILIFVFAIACIVGLIGFVTAAIK